MEEIDLREKREKIVRTVKNFFSSNEGGEEQGGVEEKRQQLIKLWKEKKQWFIYLALAAIIIFGLYIRTQNFWLLKDITNGAWLSTDLDSHIYLKYAKEILAKGYLPAVDYMRFVPFGAPTANYAFPAYAIFYLYKFLHFFNPSVTIEYADVLYPLVCFAVGVIFFFLLARKIFNTKVALLSSLLLVIIPAYLQRTMGGSSDHDALGMMFLLISLYFFLLSWQSSQKWKTMAWGAAAGISTGLTGLSWGAWKFLALIFSVFILIEFFLQKVEDRHVYAFTLWLITSVAVMVLWVPLFSLKYLIKSIPTVLPLFVLLILVVDLLLFKRDLLKVREKWKGKIPLPLVSIMISVVLGILVLAVVLGPEGINAQLKEAKLLLLHPMGKDRWELTVAEQHQPYFKDIVGSFGPSFGPGASSLPLAFTFFLIGLVILNYRLFKGVKKRVTFTLVSVLFFLALLWSRYTSGSILDGTTPLSIGIYFGSFLVAGGLFIYYYCYSFSKDKESYTNLLKCEGSYFLLLVWLLFMLIAARGAIRLVFLVTPVIVLLAAYGLVEISQIALAFKKKAYTYLVGGIILFVLLSPFAYPFAGLIPDFARNSLKQATYSGSPYDQQWQLAGSWVRENLPKEAVFGHWWDYGYWVQNGLERASVLDGANKVKYWNYLMGRHVLCGQNQTEALEFLKVHNTTHYLIVADEIGKYTAYSSIGSDKNFDRYSWITTFRMNPQATQETRNETVFVYQGGFVLDDDFVWNNVVYPRGEAGIGAVFLPVQEKKEMEGNITEVSLEIRQPTAALIYREKRVDVPLECVYFNGKMMRFDKPGLKGCFRMVPTLDDKGQPDNLLGAGMYVSEEGVKALWVNLYIFEQNNPDFDTTAFKSVYEDRYISTIALYRGRLIGPLKIWEIDYPKGFKISKELESLYLGGNELLPDYFFEV